MTIYIILCLVPIIFAGIAAVIIVSRRIDSHDAPRLSMPTHHTEPTAEHDEQELYPEDRKAYSQSKGDRK